MIRRSAMLTIEYVPGGRSSVEAEVEPLTFGLTDATSNAGA